MLGTSGTEFRLGKSCSTLFYFMSICAIRFRLMFWTDGSRMGFLCLVCMYVCMFTCFRYRGVGFGFCCYVGIMQHIYAYIYILSFTSSLHLLSFSSFFSRS